MENVVLSQFAQMRVRDRMGMTQEELIERIKQNKYAVVGIRKTRERSPLKSVVVWDHVANKPFLVNFFKENEKGSLIVATVVNTFKDHKYAKGVFVTRKHIVMARLAIAPQKVSRKSHLIVENLDAEKKEEKNLKVFFLYKKMGRTYFNKVRLCTLLASEFVKRFGSLTSFYSWYLENNGEMEVPPSSCTMIVLQSGGEKRHLERIVIHEEKVAS